MFKINSDRDIGNDLLRALAIFCVILTHTTADWDKFHNNVYSDLYSIIRPLFNIWIPLFLIISGYYIGRTEIKTFSDYRLFLCRRLSRIFLPYLIICLILFAPKIYSGEANVFDFTINLMKGSILYPYYFIPILIKFYLLYPVLLKLLKNYVVSILSILLFTTLFLYVEMTTDPFRIKQFWLSGFLFRKSVQVTWMLFFFIGIIFRRNNFLSNMKFFLKQGLKFGSYYLFSTCILVFLYSIFISNSFITMTVLALLLFILVNYYEGSYKLSQLKYFVLLGQGAYTIYLFHEPYLGLFTSWFYKTYTEMESLPLLAQGPLVCMAIFFPLCIRWLFYNIFPRQAKYIVG
jgi:probable poly-beta-1,6-N-acetyl-D-glucosamine export protein